MDSAQKQKRARSQLSCTPCRVGKLKCCRSKPVCSQCDKRNKASACVYPPPAARSRRDNNVKNRVRHLEQLVQQLASGQNTDSPVSREQTGSSASPDGANGVRAAGFELTPPDSENGYAARRESEKSQSADDHPSLALGQLKINGGETNYVGTSHWTSVLDGISDLKRELEDDADEIDSDGESSKGEDDVSNIGSLLRSPKRLTKMELLQSLPPKSEVDILVSMWFTASDPFKPILHKVQFEKEYRQFWKNPPATSSMWLGLLFAIMCQGSISRSQSIKNSGQKDSDTRAEVDKYLELSASAIVLADYTKPKPFVIEALLFYAAAWRSRAPAFEMWLLLGVIVRLALRIGIHRDGRHYGSSLTPYMCEMRRRMYSVIYMADVLTSFQLGLPGMLRSIQSDTEPPSNLIDQDFDADSKALPPERPAEEFTPCAYGNAKVRICRVFADAAELSHSTIAPSYSNVMEVDHRLEQARASIPPSLRSKAFDMGVTESPEVILCCINLDILYHKTKCVLHRGFMISTASQSSQAYSQMECLKSAMQILQHYHTMNAASKPGGRLEFAAFHIHSFAKADYLMASMIICVELNQRSKDSTFSTDSDHDVSVPRQEMITTLEKTKAIWDEAIGEHSRVHNLDDPMNGSIFHDRPILRETTKACKAISTMLQIVKARSNNMEWKSGLEQGMSSCMTT